MEEQKEPVVQSHDDSVKAEKQTKTLSEGEQRYANDLIRYKKEAQELKDQLASIELEKEQKKGNYQGVISKLKDDLAQSKKQVEEIKLNFATNTLDDAIRQEALAKGIKGQQLDVFMKLVDDNAKGVVEFDEKFKVKREDVGNLVDDHLKRYSDVFKAKVNVVDAAPNNKVVSRPSNDKKIEDMSAAEYKEYVLTKYGK